MKYSYQKDKTYIYKKHLYQKDKIYKLLSKMEGEIDIKSSGLADFIEQNGGVLYQNECISLGSESILQLAFKHNDYVAINSMIEKFPELLSAKTVKDYSLMHIAATCVDEEMIEYLIGKDDQLMYIRGKDETNPLHIACMHGNSSAIKNLWKLIRYLLTKQIAMEKTCFIYLPNT